MSLTKLSQAVALLFPNYTVHEQQQLLKVMAATNSFHFSPKNLLSMKKLILTACSITLLLLTSCKDEPLKISLPIGSCNQENNMTKNETVTEVTTSDSDNLNCITETVLLEAGNPARLIADPNEPTNIGLLHDYPKFQQGILSTIHGNYTPTNFYINVPGLANPTVEIPNISSAEGVKGMNELINRLSGTYEPAVTIGLNEKVYNQTDFNIKVGIHAHAWFVADANFNFEWTNKNIHYRRVASYVWRNFTIGIDMKSTDEWFEGQPKESVECPIVASSVTYGGMYLVIIESTQSNAKFDADIEAAVDLLFAGGGSKLEAHHKAALRMSRVKFLVIGGSGQLENKYKVMNPSTADLEKFTMPKITFSKERPGVPINVTYKFLDGSVASLKAATTYQRTTCEPKTCYFKDCREIRSGSQSAHALELILKLPENYVMTGFGANIEGNNPVGIWAEARRLYPDGRLGSRENFYKGSGNKNNPNLDIRWVAPAGFVLNNIGGGVMGNDKFKPLKVTYAKPKIIDGKLTLTEHTTKVLGGSENEVETFPPYPGKQQVIQGVGMRVAYDKLTTLALWVADVQ